MARVLAPADSLERPATDPQPRNEKLPADYHTHTPLCRHATGEPEAFCDAALAAGLSEYGISDHAPARPEPFDDWRMAERELPEYFEWIERARRHADGRIAIRSGLECDWLEGCGDWIRDLAGRHPWDYLIGSVHYLGDWDFDNPKWLGRWETSDPEAVWSHYWETYAAMAASGLFDIFGHPDLVKKFGVRPGGDLTRFYQPVIEEIAASGGAIEINTAGLHKPCAAVYPAPEFLALARDAGIPLVISSDAHSPSEVARDFRAAIGIARDAGYEETVLFEGRRMSREPLPQV